MPLPAIWNSNSPTQVRNPLDRGRERKVKGKAIASRPTCPYFNTRLFTPDTIFATPSRIPSAQWVKELDHDPPHRPRLGLFFLSPLVGEFLLGNVSIDALPIGLVMAPMYGGGAVLIREVARRAGKGWPTIILACPRLRRDRGGPGLPDPIQPVVFRV